MTRNQEGIINAVPGFSVDLPFTHLNDLGLDVHGVYHIVAASDNADFLVDEKSTFTATKSIKIKGRVGSKGKISVTNTDIRETSIEFTVKLSPCPPFFILDNRILSCVCFTKIIERHDHKFVCNRGCNTSYLIPGLWLGLLGGKSDTKLYHSYCPVNYCFSGNEVESYHQIPARVEDL